MRAAGLCSRRAVAPTHLDDIGVVISAPDLDELAWDGRRQVDPEPASQICSANDDTAHDEVRAVIAADRRVERGGHVGEKGKVDEEIGTECPARDLHVECQLERLGHGGIADADEDADIPRSLARPAREKEPSVDPARRLPFLYWHSEFGHLAHQLGIVFGCEITNKAAARYILFGTVHDNFAHDRYCFAPPG